MQHGVARPNVIMPRGFRPHRIRHADKCQRFGHPRKSHHRHALAMMQKVAVRLYLLKCLHESHSLKRPPRRNLVFPKPGLIVFRVQAWSQTPENRNHRYYRVGPRYRVHAGMRLKATGLCLYCLCTADFTIIFGHGAIKCHVLRFKRYNINALSFQDSA
jgi:hypothetical protein